MKPSSTRASEERPGRHQSAFCHSAICFLIFFVCHFLLFRRLCVRPAPGEIRKERELDKALGLCSSAQREALPSRSLLGRRCLKRALPVQPLDPLSGRPRRVTFLEMGRFRFLRGLGQISGRSSQDCLVRGSLSAFARGWPELRPFRGVWSGEDPCGSIACCLSFWIFEVALSSPDGDLRSLAIEGRLASFA